MTLLEEYLGEAAELYKSGGFAQEIDYTNFVAGLHEALTDWEGLRSLVGDEVFGQLVQLGEKFASCRREGHVWSRYTSLEVVPEHMFGYKAKERICHECGLTQYRTFTAGGRVVQNRSIYPVGYQLTGTSGKRQVYRAHMWILVAKAEIDNELTTIRRRAGQKRRHLHVA